MEHILKTDSDVFEAVLTGKKLQTIEDMGVHIHTECPDIDYGIFTAKCSAHTIPGAKETTMNICGDCWIKTLEAEGRANERI